MNMFGRNMFGLVNVILTCNAVEAKIAAYELRASSPSAPWAVNYFASCCSCLPQFVVVGMVVLIVVIDDEDSRSDQDDDSDGDDDDADDDDGVDADGDDDDDDVVG